MNSDLNRGWGERPREPARGDARPTGPEEAPDDCETGLPFLPSWRAVYLVVLVSFAVYVLLLVVLERLCS